MPVWNHRIFGLRDWLTEKEDPESVRKAMTGIYNLLKSKPFMQAFEYLEDLPHCEDIREANQILEDFWDYCDDNRIWVDLKERAPKV